MVHPDVAKLAAWLLLHASKDDVLMPLIEGEKRPDGRHLWDPKSSKYKWNRDDFEKYLKKKPWYTEWGILLHDLVCIDVDDDNVALDLMHRFPELIGAARQKTSKGVHFFFRRSPACDREGYFDGARQARMDLPIDFKSRCATRTRGLVVVAPTPNKTWIVAPWDIGQLPVISDALLAKVATPRNGGAMDAARTVCGKRKGDEGEAGRPKKKGRIVAWQADVGADGGAVVSLEAIAATLRAKGFGDVTVGDIKHNPGDDFCKLPIGRHAHRSCPLGCGDRHKTNDFKIRLVKNDPSKIRVTSFSKDCIEVDMKVVKPDSAYTVEEGCDALDFKGVLELAEYTLLQSPALQGKHKEFKEPRFVKFDPTENRLDFLMLQGEEMKLASFYTDFRRVVSPGLGVDHTWHDNVPLGELVNKQSYISSDGYFAKRKDARNLCIFTEQPPHPGQYDITLASEAFERVLLTMTGQKKPTLVKDGELVSSMQALYKQKVVQDLVDNHGAPKQYFNGLLNVVNGVQNVTVNVGTVEIEKTISDERYNELKPMFEKTVFKVLDPPMFGVVDRFGKLHLYGMQQFRERFSDFEGCGIPFLTRWILDPNKRCYDKVDFAPPPLDIDSHVYNTWPGFAGEKLDVDTDNWDLGPINQHIDLLVGHDPVAVRYFELWLAHLVQRPGVKNGIAILLRGPEGCGKNIFFDFFKRVLGADLWYETNDPLRDVVGTHAEGRNNKLIVIVNETAGKDVFSAHDKFKDVITSETASYNRKGVQAFVMSSFERYVFTSNNPTPLQLDPGERRFVVVECGQDRIGDAEYFRRLAAWTKDPRSVKAFFKRLVSVQGVDDVDWIGSRPKTEAYARMAANIVPPEAMFLADKFMVGEQHETRIQAHVLLRQYEAWRQRRGMVERSSERNAKSFGMGNFIGKGVEKETDRKGTHYLFDVHKLNTYLRSIGFGTFIDIHDH